MLNVDLPVEKGSLSTFNHNGMFIWQVLGFPLRSMYRNASLTLLLVSWLEISFYNLSV